LQFHFKFDIVETNISASTQQQNHTNHTSFHQLSSSDRDATIDTQKTPNPNPAIGKVKIHFFFSTSGACYEIIAP
jgi:hypothetical protein